MTNQIFPKNKRNKWIIYIVILAILTLLLSSIFGTGEGQHLDGSAATFNETRIATLRTLFLNIPIFGFVLGTILSFIPFKGASYKQKYLRTSLLITLIIEAFFFVLSLASSIYVLLK